MIIAVDFDGTCVSHDYPYIGKEIGAAPVLRELVAAGHDLILFTMRDGKLLKEAEAWFKENKIRLMDSNRNKEQVRWTSSPKVRKAPTGLCLVLRPMDVSAMIMG